MPADPTPDLSPEERILRELRRLSRAVDRLSPAQALCLRALVSRPLTPGALAREMASTQATVTGIVDRLESRGLVTRTRDAVDRRRVNVTLTDAGRELAGATPLPLETRLLARLAALPPEERAALDGALLRLVEMLETPPPAPESP